MAVAALEAIRNFIPGMLEGLALQRCLRELLAISLGQNDMALSAVAEDNLLFAVS